MDPLSIFGASVSTLQLLGSLFKLGKVLLGADFDMSAKEIYEHCTSCIAHLQRWEMEQTGEVQITCRELREQLQSIVEKSDRLKGKNRFTKAAKVLAGRSHEYRERIQLAFERFNLVIGLEAEKQCTLANNKLNELNKKMERLQITAATLVEIPGMDSALASVREEIIHLSKATASVRDSANLIHSELQAIKNAGSTILDLKDFMQKDGQSTRAQLEKTTQVLLEQLSTNDSICKIRSELIEDEEEILWYDDHPDLATSSSMLWSTDEGKQRTARYQGVEFSVSTSSETIDEIFKKRNVADEFDQILSRAKRRRLTSVSPYFALTKRENRFQILYRYMPPELLTKLTESVPDPHVLREIVRTAHNLGQNYEYSIYQRIVNGSCTSLPRLARFQHMEFSMLASLVEKLSMELGFYVHVDGGGIADVKITVSGYAPATHSQTNR